MAGEVEALEFRAGVKYLVVVTVDTASHGPHVLDRVKKWAGDEFVPRLHEFLEGDEVVASLVLPDGIKVEVKKVEP